jgi:hypothetical protein
MYRLAEFSVYTHELGILELDVHHAQILQIIFDA